MRKNKNLLTILTFTFLCLIVSSGAQEHPTFRAIAFFTSRNDLAHISFVHEANRWFSRLAAENNFTYDSTRNWENLNPDFLTHYDLVIFLDTRPETPSQRKAFQEFIDSGGGWIGFHFSGFALTPSEFPQDWSWYHETFLGVGQFKSNTWRPTSAILRVEDPSHPVLKNLPPTFRSAPSEWYRWENDLRTTPDIKILLSIDPASFPLGTGPKLDEIWHNGYYPVAWTNTHYNMIYFNMGHNDVDYENKTNHTLSSTFSSEVQNRLILEAMLWVGNSGKNKSSKK